MFKVLCLVIQETYLMFDQDFTNLVRVLLAVAPVICREEILQQFSHKFPFYKMPAYLQTSLLHLGSLFS